MKHSNLLLALVLSASSALAADLSCELYVGLLSVPIQQVNNKMTAAIKGVEVNFYSLHDTSFDAFQAVMKVPGLNDIRAYGSKAGLKATNGYVIEYLNHSKDDEVSVTCDQ